MQHGKLTLAAAFVCALAFGGSLSSLHAEQITNVTASASSIFGTDRYPMFAVNGAGLTGITHTNTGANVAWITPAGTTYIDGAYFIIDLKKNYRLDPANTLRVWNYNQSGYADAGIRAAIFSYSLNSLTFTNIAGVTTDATNFPTTTFDQATGLDSYSNYNTVAFNTSLTGRYIKITVNGGAGVGNYGNASYVGLSEVQAFGTFVSDPTNFLGAQLTVSNATASSTFDATRSVTNLINGSGLIGLTHDTVGENTWTSAATNSAYVDFDLGMSTNLGAVRIWNDNQVNMPTLGMRTVDILVSDDPTFTTGVITNYNDIELLIAPAELGVYDNPQIIDMKGVSGRYVRISTVGNSNPNWGSSYTGMSEVQFFQWVPPPPPAGTIFLFR